MDWTLIPVFLGIGCAVGFIAGLLGLGGGMTLIPLLALLFSYEHFPADDFLRIAVATSMATIVFTSIASVRAHNQHGAALWPVFWKLAPGILIGSLAGPQIVSGMSTHLLSGVFVDREPLAQASADPDTGAGPLAAAPAIFDTALPAPDHPALLREMIGTGRIHTLGRWGAARQPDAPLRESGARLLHLGAHL